MGYWIKSASYAVAVARKRTAALLAAFAVALLYLVGVIFRVQVLGHETYRQKVLDQIMTSSAMRAERGVIYDADMNVLASTDTVWRIFLAPVDIAEASSDEGVDYALLIAGGLAPLLNVSSSVIERKARQSGTIDVTLCRSVDEKVYRDVLEFVSENGLERMVKTEASSARYYPRGDFASQLIGFTGTDGRGLFGLEYFYDDVLRGRDGYYVYAKDAKGNAMPDGYISYVEAEEGADLVTTIDSFMQTHLEYKLREIEETFDVQNRVCGIVMNVNTGAILAMATTDAFDLNDPYMLSPLFEEKLANRNLTPGTDEYKAARNEYLYTMWQNKPISEPYEPGSTFKIITVSAGLETGAVSLGNSYHCTGSFRIGGYNISCHKRGGHGTLSLAQALQQSCNPAMIQISASTGADDFYRFVEAFGYLEKTGIDLPSEGTPIFHKKENIGTTELATASFGQRFKITPLQQITAIAAVANGGYLLTPYVVEKIVAKDGSELYAHRTDVRRQVISAETARTVSAILEEGVSGTGGAKNAAVPGYKIAAKTGTSEKFDILDENGNSYLRIGSCVAFAPSDRAQIAVLIVVDEPTTAKYGSMVAAPYISDLMEVYLPYLNCERSAGAEQKRVTVGQYEGLNVEDAKKAAGETGLSVTVKGAGTTVIRQAPRCGDEVEAENGRILLYTDETQPTYVTVPPLVGKDATQVNTILASLGLNLRIGGAKNLYAGTGAVAVSQSVPAGTSVLPGTVVGVTFLHTDEEE